MGGTLVEHRRHESFEVPMGVWFGEGLSPSPLEVVSGERALPTPQKIFLVSFGQVCPT